mmetsp:Transcript_914/g.1139  ORF Transcript_914/g.1139 Transcript_914/m.1139 type:complete len:515 (+) Transcript_914:15-1559(+)
MVFRRKQKMQFASTTVNEALDDEEDQTEDNPDEYNFIRSGSGSSAAEEANTESNPAINKHRPPSMTSSVPSRGRNYSMDEQGDSKTRLELKDTKTMLWEQADADTDIYSLPNTLFLIPLGAAGHALAWRIVADTEFARNALGAKFAWWAWIAAILLWVIAFLLFLLKVMFATKFLFVELKHPSRSCYFFAPHIAAILIALALPPTFDNESRFRRIRTAILAIAAVLQVLLSAYIMSGWVGDRHSPVLAVAARSGPSHMLHIVGWPLLALLSLRLDLDRRCDFQITAAFFGPSAILWPAFIGGLAIAARDDHRAAPAHLLVAAPPSVAALFFLEQNQNNGSALASAFISIALIFILAFLRPALREIRATIGISWASVFPTALLGAALTQFAQNQRGPVPLKAVAFAGLLLNLIIIVRLLLRLFVHLFYWFLDAAVWQDPIKLHPEQIHLLRSWAGIWIYTHLPQKQHNTTQRQQDDNQVGGYTPNNFTASTPQSGITADEGEEYDCPEEESLDPL